MRISIKFLLTFLVIMSLPGFSYAVDWDEESGKPWKEVANTEPEKSVGGFFLNLGTTGIRAKYIDGSRNTLKVMYVFENSPAAGKVMADDVITGVNGTPFQTSAIKNGEEGADGGYEGPFMEFGQALEAAQAGNGTIKVTILRRDETLEQAIVVGADGNFSATYPYDCPKSDALHTQLVDYVWSSMTEVGEKKLWEKLGGEARLYAGLALLTGTDEKYAPAQKRVAEKYAGLTRGTLSDDDPSLGVWHYCFAGVYLSEYYLRTQEEWVLAELQEIKTWLEEARFNDPESSAKTKDGWGHKHAGILTGYGAFMYPTPFAVMTLGMISRCGITVERDLFDGPFASMWAATTKDNGFLWYQGDQAKEDGWEGDRARASAAAMANYFAPYNDAHYAERAKLHSLSGHGSKLKGLINGHGSNLTYTFIISLAHRLDPQGMRNTLDYFRTWYTLSQTHEKNQFITQPTRGSVSNGGMPRVTGSALAALVFATPKKLLHVHGAGGGNGEPTDNNAPEISGTPELSVSTGSNYTFTPLAADADNDDLTFSINNKPSWASFDASTGKLSGTPSSADIGEYSSITISVSDNVDTVSLGVFNLFVVSGTVENNKVKVFILAGQSNMQGKGTVYKSSQPDWKGTLQWHYENDSSKYGHLKQDDEWVVRDDTFVVYKRSKTSDYINTGGLTPKFGSDNGSIGPELGFGLKVGDHYNAKVLIIKTAWGGHSLKTHFRSPSSEGETGDGYIHMINDVKTHLENIGDYVDGYDGEGYEIKGFCWFQGWNDGTEDTTTEEYEDLFTKLISDVRNEWDAPEMPVVIASSGNGGTEENMGSNCITLRDVIEPAQKSAATKIDNCSYFPTREMWPDIATSYRYSWAHWQFNAGTYYDIGTKMGTEMLTLLAVDPDGGSGGGSGGEEPNTDPLLPINFNDYYVNGVLPEYRERDGTYTVAGSKKTKLTLTGNKIVYINKAITVTSSTVLEFGFASSSEGRYHMIGLLKGGIKLTKNSLQMYGTEAKKTVNQLEAYFPTGTNKYKIKLSDFMELGDYDGLFFDNNAPNTDSAHSFFNNVRIYEDIE